MSKMKAVGLYKHLPVDHEESLIDLELDKPKAEGRDLLVRVEAVGVNPVDYKVRANGDTETEAKVLGWDVAGVVVETGAETSLFKKGDHVYYAGDITRQGGNSEFHLIDERIVGKKPASLSFAESAALPLTTITAYEALFHRLKVSHHPEDNKGKSILIIGASGGVGSIATQLAKRAGLTVVGTASRPETEEWAKKRGADFTINHYHDFSSQLKEIQIETVDFIFCLNATEQHWSNMAESIAPQGKICSIVEMPEPVDLTMLQSKSATFVWELMFTRPMYQTDDMIKQHELLNEISGLIDEGNIQTTLNETLSPIHAANMKKAHEKLESGKAIGKIVVESFES